VITDGALALASGLPVNRKFVLEHPSRTFERGIVHKCGALDINCDKERQNTPIRPFWRTLRQSPPQF